MCENIEFKRMGAQYMKSQIPVAKGFEQVCMLFFICMHTPGGGGGIERPTEHSKL